MTDPSNNTTTPPSLVSPHTVALTHAQLKNGAHWFFWIAGMSLVNSLVWLSGSTWHFVIGLGLTEVIDGIAQALASSAPSNLQTIIPLIGLGIDIGVLSFFVLFGFLAKRGYRWIFLLGMSIYALDGIIFILIGSWLSVGFHAFALFNLYGGLKAANQLRHLNILTSMPSTSLPALEPAIPNSQYISTRQRTWRPLILILSVAFIPIAVLVGAIIYYGI